MKWIHVSHLCPREYQEVQISVKACEGRKAFTTIAIYIDGMFMDANGRDHFTSIEQDEITHWAPLMEPATGSFTEMNLDNDEFELLFKQPDTEDHFFKFEIIDKNYKHFMKGNIKWDGCADIEFADHIHFCNDPIQILSGVFDYIWTKAQDHIENFDWDPDFWKENK